MSNFIKIVICVEVFLESKTTLLTGYATLYPYNVFMFEPKRKTQLSVSTSVQNKTCT